MISRRAALSLIAAAAAPGAARAVDAGAHAFAFPGIEGGEIALADWAGRPVLVVNTASRCGFTYQYDQLQALWSRYRGRGLVVLGVPSDDFRQELASNAEVKEFCAVNFALDFPMAGITRVTGAGAHPFYAWAADRAGAPRWNFHKYLVAPDGRLAGSWGSNVEPTAPAIVEAVEATLPAG